MTLTHPPPLTAPHALQAPPASTGPSHTTSPPHHPLTPPPAHHPAHHHIHDPPHCPPCPARRGEKGSAGRAVAVSRGTPLRRDMSTRHPLPPSPHRAQQKQHEVGEEHHVGAARPPPACHSPGQALQTKDTQVGGKGDTTLSSHHHSSTLPPTRRTLIPPTTTASLPHCLRGQGWQQREGHLGRGAAPHLGTAMPCNPPIGLMPSSVPHWHKAECMKYTPHCC